MHGYRPGATNIFELPQGEKKYKMLTWVAKYSWPDQVKRMCGKHCFTFNRLRV